MILRLSRPPSANNLYVNAGKRGRVKSMPYRGWFNVNSLQVMIQRMGQQRIAGPYTLALTVQRGRGDLDNFAKAISDLCVKMNIIDDDKLAEKITLEWGDVTGCVVTILAHDATHLASA